VAAHGHARLAASFFAQIDALAVSLDLGAIEQFLQCRRISFQLK